MKRILIALMIFIAGAFGASAEELSNFDFELRFEKVGVSDIHFADEGIDNIISATAFPVSAPFTKNIDLVYHIYPGEAVEVIFASSSVDDSTYLSDGPMLTSVESDLGPAGIKLNYDVSIAGGNSISFDNDPNTLAPGRNEDVPASNRTLQVVKATDDEISGRKTMTMTVNPPSDNNGGESFMSGQYTGYVVLRLYTLE